jgi:hypothetical protein
MTHNDVLEMVKSGQIRLVICPNHVRSKYDRQLHYIDERRLLQLYGVPHTVPWINRYRSYGPGHTPWVDQNNDVQLAPRHRGDYSLVDAYKRSNHRQGEQNGPQEIPR